MAPNVVAWEAMAKAPKAILDGWNARLSRYPPTTLVLATVVVCYLLGKAFRRMDVLASRKGYRHVFFDVVTKMPLIKQIKDREKKKVLLELRKTFQKQEDPGDPSIRTLPKEGLPAREALQRALSRKRTDVSWEEGQSKFSGTVYMEGKRHEMLIADVYQSFIHANPLHGDVWPSVVKMENEIVAMTAGMLGANEVAGERDICGSLTSGGSESILCAVKASRDYMAQKKGILWPEMIIAESAHAAFWKAAEYFRIKLHVLKVNKDYVLDANTVRKYLSSNTVLVVASAPSFPHGVVDEVAKIAGLAKSKGICCHVDCCLGGFCLPFVRQLGYPVPPFDFSVDGVTSMSADTHKFGFAPKGTSVVLYSSREIRIHQWTSVVDWTGGLYISPSMAGSRPGALIAACWASIMHLGRDGYMEATRKIMVAAEELKDGVSKIDGLQVVGDPVMGCIALASNEVNIYAVGDILKEDGWHINVLQRPPAFHFCITAANAGSIKSLLCELKVAVDTVRKDPGIATEGTAPIYGMASAVPDRGAVEDILAAAQDMMSRLPAQTRN